MDITDKLYSYNPKSVVLYGLLVTLAIYLSHVGVVEYQSSTLEMQRWVDAAIGFVANFGIVYHHMTVPPHPKFMLAKKRRINIRLHAFFGISEVLAGTVYCCQKKIMATIKLTAELFKEDIFNYETSKEWKYKDDVPAIIDFYADWCGPCKAVAPILEELSTEYEGRLKIYKVNTEIEQELSSIFQIRSIPSILFVPVGGKQPMMQAGALPKDALIDAIEKELLKPVEA